MATVYGYARISTEKQSIERQVRNILSEYPAAVIIREAYTGTKIDRPEFENLLKLVRAGDTIVFDSVSRMSRNAEDGFKCYAALMDRGVELVFLKEPYINTAAYKKIQSESIPMTGNEIADCYIEATNKVMRIMARNQIQIAFDQAEKEVADLHQRTKEGILTARRAGKQIGQQQGATLHIKKKAPAKEKILEYSKTGLKDSDIIKLIGLARNTYYKYKRELRDEGRLTV